MDSFQLVLMLFCAAVHSNNIERFMYLTTITIRFFLFCSSCILLTCRAYKSTHSVYSKLNIHSLEYVELNTIYITLWTHKNGNTKKSKKKSGSDNISSGGNSNDTDEKEMHRERTIGTTTKMRTRTTMEHTKKSKCGNSPNWRNEETYGKNMKKK